jgi:hypothetical protein
MYAVSSCLLSVAYDPLVLMPLTSFPAGHRDIASRLASMPAAGTVTPPGARAPRAASMGRLGR